MSTRRNLIFAYLDRYASLVTFMVSSLIIARLLTPAEFGLFSITAVIVSFAAPFRDLGASQYLINTRELTERHIRAVWALQLTLGVVIAAVLFACRGWAAHLYRSPEIADILLVLCVNSLVTPFGALTSAWLSREMRFDALGLTRFSGNLASSVVSVLLAWRGHGAISLAYGSLLGSLVTALVGVFFRPSHFPWMPSFRGIRDVVGFGSSVSATTLLRLATVRAPELISGRLLGMEQTGLLARAFGYVGLFERLVMDSIATIAQPSFSKLRRQNADMGAAYLQATDMMMAAGVPLLVFMALMCEPMITVLYGEAWRGSVEAARVLCLAAVFMLPGRLAAPVLTAAGLHWRVVLLQGIQAAMQVCLVLLAASHGLVAVSFAVLAASLASSLFWTRASLRAVGRSIADLGAVLRQATLIGLGTAALPAVLLTTGALLDGHPAWLLACGFCGAAIGFLATLATLKHPLWQELLSMLRRLRPVQATER